MYALQLSYVTTLRMKENDDNKNAKIINTEANVQVILFIAPILTILKKNDGNHQKKGKYYYKSYFNPLCDISY